MVDWSRIRHRKLAQWGVAYLAGAWVLLQVLGFVGQSFSWSPQVARIATVLAIAGFFVVLILAWYHGERGRQRVRLGEGIVLAVIVIAGVSAAWVLRGAPASNATASTNEPAEPNSIAVLPFVDMSAAGDQEYFSDGITDEILNTLAATPGLRVAARTSSFAFKGKEVDVAEIGRRLHVASVLEGSVRKAGNTLRITAQLIDARNGFHIWSATFDRELKDIFQLQEEISRAIVSKLQPQAASDGVPTVHTTNQAAFDLYLRGRYFLAKRTPDGLKRAEQYFTRAVQSDPRFAPAHAGLAATLLVLPLYVDTKPEQVRPRARAAVLRALELDSALADAWASLAYVRMSYEHDWDGADAAFRRALQLNPNDSNTRMWYADFSAGRNRKQDAIAHYEQAVRLDPLSPARHFGLGWMYMTAGRFEESDREFELAIELDPTLVDSYTHQARLRLFQGRHEEAIAKLEQVVERSGRRALELGYLGHAYGVAGQRADAQKILDELQMRARTVYVSPLTLAMVYTGLGDADRAFAALEQARADGDMWLTENHVDLIFEPLRSDARWGALLNRMGVSATPL